jgi:putative redox protein
VLSSGRRFRLRRQLIEELEQHRIESAIGELSVPLLVMHSPDDRTVPIDHARRIYRAARHPKSFISLDGADHLLAGRPEDAEFVAELLSAWASRYVEGADRPEVTVSDDEAPELEPGTVVVRGGEIGFAQRVEAGPHRLAADEPERVGGTDTGPNPYDLLLASLGACKSMTMKMYAGRKGWPLTGTVVRLKHSRIHAEDCEECETEKGRIDRIEVEIELEGELTDEQRARILEIADRCPVHRTLKSETDIRSRLVSV